MGACEWLHCGCGSSLLGAEQHLWSRRQPADPTTSPPTKVLRNPVSEELDESSSLTATELRRRGFEPYNQQVGIAL